MLGVEVLGFKANQDDPDSEYERIRHALAEHCVLVIRDQPMSDLEVAEFLDRIAVTFDQWNITPEFLSPDTPKVYYLSSHAGGSRYAGSTWHADYAFMDDPADVSCMQMRKLPPGGGDTRFANMYVAYDALSGQMKDLIANLTAIFDNCRRRRLQYATENAAIPKEQLDRVPIARHPLVITHPLTGRKALYCSEALVDTIVELTPSKAKLLSTSCTTTLTNINSIIDMYRARMTSSCSIIAALIIAPLATMTSMRVGKASWSAHG